ncbi:hypothetical protein MN608_05427 [Microdochium nivale]|nr:hypothetical protein MN608_05427 [Microdochium nivale]
MVFVDIAGHIANKSLGSKIRVWPDGLSAAGWDLKVATTTDEVEDKHGSREQGKSALLERPLSNSVALTRQYAAGRHEADGRGQRRNISSGIEANVPCSNVH